MRIIANAISAHTGGMVTYTTNFLRYMATAGISGSVFVPPTLAENLQGENLDDIEMNGIDLSDFSSIRRAIWEQTDWRKIVAASGADILFSSANYGMLTPPMKQLLLVQGEVSFLPLYRKKIIPRMNFTERLEFALRRFHVSQSIKHSDLVVFPSLAAREAIFGKRKNNKAIVNHLATNETLFDRKHPRQWREDGVLRMLYVSVYYPHKDPLTLARAVRTLNRQGIKAEARITMEASDFYRWSMGYDEYNELKTFADTGEVSLGRLPHAQIRDALDQFDLIVFPSLAETFGFPLVEAMAGDMALVVSDIPTHREVCDTAATYFRPLDSDDLVKAIMDLDSSPDRRTQMRGQGRERTAEMFRWDRHMNGMMDSLKGMMG